MNETAEELKKEVERLQGLVDLAKTMEHDPTANGNGTQSIIARVGDSFLLKIKMKYAIPGTILSMLGFGSYAYTRGDVGSVQWQNKVNDLVTIEPERIKRIGQLEIGLFEVRNNLNTVQAQIKGMRLEQMEHYYLEAVERGHDKTAEVWQAKIRRLENER